MAPVLFQDLPQGAGLPNCIIRCPFDKCNTRIIKLDQTLAQSVTEVPGAPKMTVDLRRFFVVNDVWDFDNIGVSKPTDTLESVESLAKVERLLVCSECDQGPLGFAGYSDASETDVKKLQYFLACEAVVYDL